MRSQRTSKFFFLTFIFFSQQNFILGIHVKYISKSFLYILSAILLGVLAGWSQQEIVLETARTISNLFMNFLKMIAGPIVFLSIFSTLLGMSGFGEMKTLGKRVFVYTLLTTVIAATLALILFVVLNPADTSFLPASDWDHSSLQQSSYLSIFLNIIPANLVQAFLENNVMGIAFLAFVFGIAALKLPQQNKEVLNQHFSSLFKLILKVAEMLIFIMPFGIWAFVTILVDEVQQNSAQLKSLLLYLSVILGANLVQGFVVLPILLKLKGLSPIKAAKGSLKALLMAFFSKSSNATLPITLQCAENNLGIRPKIAYFSLPLCTVINMNGCAAFILTTVLFVSEMQGMTFTAWQLILWVLLATIAAIGNAGVPMGCFFLSSAFLVALGVPLNLLGIILPFYAFLDMIETALNVWSDIAVTAIVDKEHQTQIVPLTAS